MAGLSESLAIPLLCACLALLIWLLAAVAGLSRRLGRLEGRLSPASSPSNAEQPEDRQAEEKAGGGLFETFLAEEPARRELPKSEQFAAYRQWRRTKGMNWGEGVR